LRKNIGVNLPLHHIFSVCSDIGESCVTGLRHTNIGDINRMDDPNRK
jgi:hypothetical protein